MDDAHLHNAIRYVSLNPVRARLVKRARDWEWSSVRAHLAGRDDGVVRVAPVLERVGDFARFLDEPVDEDAAYAALRRAETIGRPIGDPDWLEALEARTGRTPLIYHPCSLNADAFVIGDAAGLHRMYCDAARCFPFCARSI